jgi:O-antigen/teichoic acid export membrane protein
MANSPLLQAGLLLSVTNGLVGLLGYVYQVLMGRLLAPGDFALFSTLMALVMVVGAPLGAMVMLLARRVASLNAVCRRQSVARLYWKTHAWLAGAAVLFCLAFQSCMPWALESVKSSDAVAMWLFGGSVVLGAVGLVNSGFLQGLERFRWLGGMGVAGAASKIAISVGLVTLCGGGVRGALGGVLASTLLVWGAGTWALRRDMLPQAAAEPEEDDRMDLRGVPAVVVASVAFAAMTQLDMVLVNRYFDSGLAAQYAAASVLGKAVLYLPGGLVLALLPIVAARQARKQSSGTMLGQALLITFLLCGAAAICYAACGRWLIGLLYGDKYPEAGGLLASYGFAILPMALVMVAEHFLIAQGRVVFAWLFVLIAPLQVAAIHAWHPNLQAVIGIMGLCGTVLAVAGCGILLWESRRKRP